MTPADSETYRKYADELVRFASGLVGPSGAEDVVANAVFNEACSQQRSTTRRLNREIRAYQRDVSHGFEGGYVDVDVLVALRCLSERQRAVIHLTYWADLPVTDIASLLDLSMRTVERELTRARTRLEELLS